MLETPYLISIAGLLVGIFGTVVALLTRLRLEKMGNFQKELFSGRQAADLDALIFDLKNQIQKNAQDIKTLSHANRIVAELQHGSIQHVGLVRFNSFADAGGNNSFALSLLNGEGDGIVLSSLFGRDSVRIYAKPVSGGESPIPLTAEEKQAILESQFADSSSHINN